MTTAKAPSPLFILASASPRRKEILIALGLDFSIDPSRLQEPPRRPEEAPHRYAMRVARVKAGEVSKNHHRGIVIGADTVVAAGARLFGKPSGEEEARTMVRSLSGRWHEVITGLCLVECRSGRTLTTHVRSRVHFRRVVRSEIDWYLTTGEYRDKAGAYAIQGYASAFIDRIEGCYFNIVGFPVSAFERLCRRMGISLLRLCARGPLRRPYRESV